MQRTANPCMPVRFRPRPPLHQPYLTNYELVKLIRTNGRKYIRDFMVVKWDFDPLLAECGMRVAVM